MGFGIPAALGAKAAHPDRRVVAVVGDGDFMMSGMELAAAVQERLPIVVVLINDNTLTLIRATQERRYGGRFIGVDLAKSEFRDVPHEPSASVTREPTPTTRWNHALKKRRESG